MSSIDKSEFIAKRGVIYVATGIKYIEEAAVSARTVKEHMPELPIVLHTDLPGEAGPEFDHVVKMSSATHTLTDKVDRMLDFRFEESLFLDTDTIVCRRCDELFELLGRFEVAAAFEPARHPGVLEMSQLPESFAEINTGVILYKATDNIRDLFQEWTRITATLDRSRLNVPYDQVSFREALFQSGAQFFVLPEEYNLRVDFPGFLAAGARPAILHIRQIDEAGARAVLARSTSIRVFLPGLQRCKREHFQILSPRIDKIAEFCLSLNERFVLPLRTWIHRRRRR